MISQNVHIFNIFNSVLNTMFHYKNWLFHEMKTLIAWIKVKTDFKREPGKMIQITSNYFFIAFYLFNYPVVVLCFYCIGVYLFDNIDLERSKR